MFNSYEAGRAGYVTLVANYLPLQDAYGGPNYFKLDPNALYEIHVDNNGDGKEDITFQFRFNNTLQGRSTLPIGGTNVAIPLTQAGQVSAPDAAALERQRDLHRRRRPRRPPRRQRAAGDQRRRRQRDLRQAGRQHRRQDDPRLRRLRGAARLHASTSPAARTPGKVFVGQRKDPFAVNLGVIFDLVNVPGAADFTPGRSGVPARPDAEGRRRRRPAPTRT